MEDILSLIGEKCDGVIGQVSRADYITNLQNLSELCDVTFGFSLFSLFCLCLQLTEDWGEVLFSALRKAGGRAFSNMAVGYNNVDVNAATKYGVSVGNTPVSLISSVK